MACRDDDRLPGMRALEEIAALDFDMVARCWLCRFRLERPEGQSLRAGLACALATFVLLLAANALPLLTVHLMGAERVSFLGSGIVFMRTQGWVIMALFLGAFGIVLPLIRFAGLTVVLGMLMLRLHPGWLGRLYRCADSVVRVLEGAETLDRKLRRHLGRRGPLVKQSGWITRTRGEPTISNLGCICSVAHRQFTGTGLVLVDHTRSPG